jgi:hypothetical protein
MSRYRQGDTVTWNWGQGEASGKVVEVFTDRVEKRIKGSKVTRNADDDNPAYLLEQEDGDRVLKSHSELSKA